MKKWEEEMVQKENELLKEWEIRTKAKNPAYVMWSLRRATPEEELIIEGCSGLVCKIRCLTCNKEQVVSKSNAYHQHCQSCTEELTS